MEWFHFYYWLLLYINLHLEHVHAWQREMVGLFRYNMAVKLPPKKNTCHPHCFLSLKQIQQSDGKGYSQEFTYFFQPALWMISQFV